MNPFIGAPLSKVLRELGYGQGQPWHRDSRFWCDFNKIYQMANGEIIPVPDDGNKSLIGLVQKTRTRGKVGKMTQQWNTDGQLKQDDPSILHLESTRIDRGQREPHVIGDYNEIESDDSPIVSTDDDDRDESVTIPSFEMTSLQKALPRSYAASRTSSTETLANGETIDEDIGLYDDIDQIHSRKTWKKKEASLQIVDLLLQFPNGINRVSFNTQFYQKHPEQRIIDIAEHIRKNLSHVVKHIRIESISVGVMRMKVTKPRLSTKIILRPYYKLHSAKTRLTQAMLEATAKIVRDTFRRLLRMMSVFGRGIFEDEIEGNIKFVHT